MACFCSYTTTLIILVAVVVVGADNFNISLMLGFIYQTQPHAIHPPRYDKYVVMANIRAHIVFACTGGRRRRRVTQVSRI